MALSLRDFTDKSEKLTDFIKKPIDSANNEFTMLCDIFVFMSKYGYKFIEINDHSEIYKHVRLKFFKSVHLNDDINFYEIGIDITFGKVYDGQYIGYSIARNTYQGGGYREIKNSYTHYKVDEKVDIYENLRIVLDKIENQIKKK